MLLTDRVDTVSVSISTFYQHVWLGMPHTEAVWGSFSFFQLQLLTGQPAADQVNTLCGSLVWSFILITHCHAAQIEQHFLPVYSLVL